MYGTNEYPTQRTYSGGASRRRTWLAAGGALAAVLVLLILVAAACNARSDRPESLAAGASATTEATQDVAGVGAAGEDQDGGEQAGGPGDPAPPDNPENPDPPQNPEPPDDDEEPEQPAPPLSIEASVDVVTPGGQCFASGTIAVGGGEYPVTVHYQWRRLVQGEGLDGVAVSAVQNHTFSEAGAIQVQTSNLPEDGTNVFLVVTGPKQTGSGLVEYQGCEDGPGDIAPND